MTDTSLVNGILRIREYCYEKRLKEKCPSFCAFYCSCPFAVMVGEGFPTMYELMEQALVVIEKEQIE